MAFNELKLEWKGVTRVIPPNKMLMAIAVVEEVLPMDVLASYSKKGTSIARLSQAYGALLRYAGFDASDEDVYEGIFKRDTNAGVVVQQAIMTLMTMMLPTSALADAQPSEDKELGNRKSRRARASSRKHTKPSLSS